MLYNWYATTIVHTFLLLLLFLMASNVFLLGCQNVACILPCVVCFIQHADPLPICACLWQSLMYLDFAGKSGDLLGFPWVC